MATHLRMFTTDTGSESTVELGGDLDLAAIPDVRAHLAAVIDDGTDVLVIDMAQVEFCDSSTLRVLVAAHDRMRSKQGQLRIVNPTPRTVRLLSVAGLEGLLADVPPV